MNNTKIFFYLIAISLLLIGCQNLQKSFFKAEHNVNAAQSELDERSRQLTTLIVEVAEKERNENQNKTNSSNEIILVAAKKDQQIEGLPIEKLNTEEIIALYAKDKAALEKKFNEYSSQIEFLQKNKTLAEIQRDKFQSLWQEELNRPWYEKLWDWMLGIALWGGGSGIIIIALLSIFVPGFATVLLPWIIGRVIDFFPKLATVFGVVSKKSFDAVIGGYENFKDKWKEMEDDDFVSKKEMINGLKSSYRASVVKTDAEDLIEARKKIVLGKKNQEESVKK